MPAGIAWLGVDTAEASHHEGEQSTVFCVCNNPEVHIGEKHF